MLSGATFDLNGTTQTIGSLQGGGSVSIASGALNTGGNNALTLFAGFMSGAGSFTKAGTGTMTFSGAQGYTGATTIAAGTLRFDPGGSLSSLSAVNVLSGATFDLNNTTQTIGSLGGAGSVLMGAGSLTAGGNNGSTTFTGVLSGSASFNKACSPWAAPIPSPVRRRSALERCDSTSADGSREHRQSTS